MLQVEIFGAAPVVVRAHRLAEPFHRSARCAAVKVVDRDVGRALARLASGLVLRRPDCRLTRRLPPGEAPREPEQQPDGE
jgi:hypothetical protein